MEKINVENNGYGIIFKSLTRNPNIDIEAKGLFSYLTTYAGSKDNAYPSVDLICHELNISTKRFQKYRKQLVEAGYLSISREKSSNLYGRNVYTLYHEPRQVQIRPVENETMQIESVENLPTKNNSTKNNSIKNNISKRDDTQNSIDYINHNLEIITSPMKIQEIEYLVNDIKNQKLEIVKVATNYCKQNKKGINYLIKVLTNWINEDIDTKEKAEAKIQPKKLKAKSDNFGDLRQKILGGVSND